ncbi:DUF58 domain-containing protein [Marinobacter sp. F4216]|uniref:DUF58 domain-containing protein n=1 Tax=Marinobacter sp. F4216 TaxID=2874281 RepID=UPI001CC0F168|nr:DUF58 domain-containing protein [Marinobacter sp. F4216]MBZ2169829.1 DUF58 domain-containing protein [Marinobacter sp. F4216]
MRSGPAPLKKPDTDESLLDDPAVYVDLRRLMGLETEGRLINFRPPFGHSSQLTGHHKSRLRGRGLDFEELKHYQPGDDLRHLDWRATRRTGKPFVRSFTEERDRPTLVVCDQRMDMFFGSSLNFKSLTAAELAALVAWSAFHSGDRVGGLVFNDQWVETVPAHRSRQRLQQFFATVVRHNRALHAQQPGRIDHTTLDQVLIRCLNMAHHDHTICLISDFSGIGESTLRRMRQLSQHNNVIAFQVYDPVALNLPQRSRVTLVDGNLQVPLHLGKKSIHKPVADFLKGRLARVADLMRKSRIPLCMISAGEATAGQYRRALAGRAGWQR